MVAANRLAKRPCVMLWVAPKNAPARTGRRQVACPRNTLGRCPVAVRRSRRPVGHDTVQKNMLSDPHCFDPAKLSMPLVDNPFLEAVLAQGWPRDRAEQMRRFARDGYLVIDLADDDFNRKAACIIDDVAQLYPGQERRYEDAWYDSEDVRSLATDARVLELLGSLYQRRPIPFQTLNFRRGSEQAAHSDTVHFHCVPARYMVGVWVALEDVDAYSGPLVVYPGSQHLPDLGMFELDLDPTLAAYTDYEVRVRELLAVSGFPAKEVYMRKGQALIWSANLYHGGSPIRDPARTRHSQVTHYYFEDGVYYTPKHSYPQIGRLCLREVIDIARGEFVTHRFRGETIDLFRYDDVWRYPRPLPSWVKKPVVTATNGHPPSRPGDLAAPLQDDDTQRTIDHLRQRADALEQHVGKLSDDADALRLSLHRLQERYEDLLERHEITVEDNKAKDRFIKQRDEEFPYRVCRRVTKTWQAVFPPKGNKA